MNKNVSYSREKALSQREFEQLLRGVRKVDCELRRLESRMIAYAGGRLGMRPGEITHLREDWINWRRRRIEIPLRDPCDQGREGGLCGSCRQSVRQRVEHHNMTLGEARMEVLRQGLLESISLPGHVRDQLTASHLAHVRGSLSDDVLEDQLANLLAAAEEIPNGEEVLDALNEMAREQRDDYQLTEEEAKELLWSPKTENASRQIQFDWCPRAEIALEEYFDRFPRWMNSQTCITRRVDRMLKYAPELDVGDTTPHGLRATAASHLAGKGLSAAALMSHFGWSQIATAERYIRDSPEQTHSQLLETRSR